MFAIKLLHGEPFAVSINKRNVEYCQLTKIAIHFFYKNDFLQHEAHFCSKFKTKLKTMPASTAKQAKNKKKIQISNFLVFASKIATIQALLLCASN